MQRRMGLNIKIPVVLVGFALVTGAVVGVTGYFVARSALLMMAEAHRNAASGVNDDQLVASGLTHIIEMMLLAALLTTPLVVGAGFWLTRKSVKTLTKVAETLAGLAKGQTDIELIRPTQNDEIGDLVSSLAVVRKFIIRYNHTEIAEKVARDKERQRQARMQELVDNFRGNVSNVIASVETEIEGIRSTSGVLTSVADNAAVEATSAQEASAASASNVDAVASTVEQLSTSIREIAERAQRASDHVVQASNVARKTDQDVSGLAAAAEKVGAIVDLIRDIAEQTNLLALNATIEAARAGEAGRGFAVVASEVKQLASQTSKATQDISLQINEIQSATRNAVEAIRQIAATVSEIESLTGSIAAAVQEQDAATGEIFTSVASAADRSRLLARNVDQLSSAISDTNREAQQVMMVSYQLSAVASVLSSDVEEFINGVATDVNERRLSQRYSASGVTVVSPDGMRKETECVDISETGARIVAVPGLRMGGPVTIEMDDGLLVTGSIVWIENEQAGIQFEKSLGAQVFDYVVTPSAAAA